jgi:Alcohol dehydrogenase GroES-like domain
MKAARMHEYGKALVLEDVPVPDIQPDEILVNVRACGMCRCDVQLVDGYFRKYADIPTPITLGHEITGVVHKIGGLVPKRPKFRRFRVSRTRPLVSFRGEAPCALVRDARPSDALALRPRQREPAAQRPTLRATISQRRWPRPPRPLQWRVLGFQDQAARAVRTVHSRNGTRPPAQRRIGRMRVQRSFRRA